MPIEPVKIPQNVYVEDRIIGPITLRQLIVMGIGAGISYVLYASATKGGPVSIPLTIALWSPTMLAAAFAFLKVNDLTLFNIILLLIEHANKPSQRTWCQHPGLSITIYTNTSSDGEAQKAEQKNIALANKLTEMAKKLETQQAELSKIIGGEGQPSVAPIDDHSVSVDGITKALPQNEPHEVQAEGSIEPLSVDRSRVETNPPSPRLSIDGIAPKNLGAFSHIFSEHTP